MSADSTSPIAPSVDEILSKLGPIVREKVLVQGRVFWLERPGESDRLIDLPVVHEAFAKDEYMPYWADLWPAARMLAKAVLNEPWTPGTHALEIGCGLGLAGVVGLACGLRVTFSDYDPCALEFASRNARLNGYLNFDTVAIDWRLPPLDRQTHVLLASDLIYEMRNVPPIIEFIHAMLLPGGVCLLTDVDRVPSSAFRAALGDAGLHFTTRVMHAGEPGGRRLKGTLYRILKR